MWNLLVLSRINVVFIVLVVLWILIIKFVVELFFGLNFWLSVLVSIVFLDVLDDVKLLKVNWWFKFFLMKWILVLRVVLLVIFKEMFNVLNCEGNLNVC